MNMQQEQTMPFSRDYSFTSKVFFYFGLAILASVAGTFTGFTYLAPFFLANPTFMWILFAVELGLIFTARLWSAKRPLNYVLFMTFAFVTGLTIVPLLALFMVQYGAGIIIKALLATTFMFAGTATFGWVTKRNLSGLGGFLWISLIGMIIVSIIGIFVPWSSTFEMLFSGFGVILFSAYIMYDIQRVKQFPTMHPMEVALALYLDIFNLFIFILRLMGASRD
ncbi:Bax inhibitor-1/YccA family protein [Patescibacteria group bacterium]|nr:Bax inhibitor-1/YccA family protein [Patescibacteria group bacterium]MBU1954335.1 Bax inhibitor-1/YccA family protein [Patescibacteria group bacterium]